MKGIHDFESRYLSARQNIENNGISPKNQKLILDFVDELILENISKPRLIKYLEILKNLALTMKKDFDKAKIEDLKKIVATIQERGYSEWTKQTYKVIIRRFFKWLYKTEEYPPIVSWMKTRMRKSEMKLPSEGNLLTEEDVQNLIKYANHPRDKAFIAVLWESGARIGEVGSLCMKHVVFDNHGAVITVQGKTGSRKVRLISSVGHLSTWLNSHHLRDYNDARVWINIGRTKRHMPMTYNGFQLILKRAFAAARIHKRSNPHLFRHSRATFLANHLTEFQMNQYFGWIQGSDMASTYVHMSGKAVDNALFALHGMENQEKKEETKYQPKICPRCDTINSYESRHCNKCGGMLDIKHALEMDMKAAEKENKRMVSDDLMSQLMQDSDVKALLAQKLKALSAVGGVLS